MNWTVEDRDIGGCIIRGSNGMTIIVPRNGRSQRDARGLAQYICDCVVIAQKKIDEDLQALFGEDHD